MGVVETLVVTNGGSLQAVCGARPAGADTTTRLSSHLHALARSVATSIFSVVPQLGLRGQIVTASEVCLTNR